jgi:hypothetical protein
MKRSIVAAAALALCLGTAAFAQTSGGGNEGLASPTTGKGVGGGATGSSATDNPSTGSIQGGAGGATTAPPPVMNPSGTPPQGSLASPTEGKGVGGGATGSSSTVNPSTGGSP